MAKSWSNLKISNTNFDNMMKRFGVVTIMNAYVYEGIPTAGIRELKVDEIFTKFYDEAATDNLKETVDFTVGTETVTINKLCKLDTLKVANIPMEGPTKTVTGGQYANPLIKYGKTARLEMQDALGNIDAIAAFSGGVVETFNASNQEHTPGKQKVLHITGNFGAPLTIIGDSFFIDQATGAKVRVKIIFYQFFPDGIFNLTQDAEGDAAVFDLNGDLLETEITIGVSIVSGEEDDVTAVEGVFYSVFAGTGPEASGSEQTDLEVTE